GEVEKHIEDSKEFAFFKTMTDVYMNSVFIESFQNDSLMIRSTDFSTKHIFKSFYLWKGDTFAVDGIFGQMGGIGFGIAIHNNIATVYHLLSSDDLPEYAYGEKDSLVFRLEVPCTDTKIVLSEIPDSAKAQVIYGYVEFKSANYFVERSHEDGNKASPRQ